MRTKPDQYYAIDPKRREWLGIRHFRFNVHCEHVIQVVSAEGDIRKGRTNAFGAYMIHRTTFLTNYLAMGYAVPCTKGQYDKAFENVVNFLQEKKLTDAIQ